MKAVVEPLEGNKVKLSVEVDEDEFEKALDAAFRRIAREVRIPGFRPGKAPRRILEARIGKESARQEALRESLPDYYARAVQETDVDPIAPPDIDITAGAESGAVAFDAVVQVRPQVSVAGHGGLRAVVPSPEVTDEEVDRQVDRLRAQGGRLETVDRPARTGDNVTLSVTATRSGSEAPFYETDDELYEIGSGTIVPELDARLDRAKVGDILTFSAPVPGDEEGDELHFRVLVKDVKEKILPEVDDEWASEASEFDTVEELLADIRSQLGRLKLVQSTLTLRKEAIRALTELVDEEVPEPLVEAELERRLHDLAHRLADQGATIEQYLEVTKTTQEELTASLRGDAVEAVRSDLALRALADAEALEATDEDLDRQIERLAAELKQPPDKVRAGLDRQGALPTVRSDIRKTKALEWLVDHVEVVDEEGRAIDRALLSPAALAESGAAGGGDTVNQEGETES